MKREDGSAKLTFDEKGLIPAVVQHATTGRVLMVAFMSRESLDKTIETGEAHFWSRRRNELWRKGATSGNVMKVVEIFADCDADCLLLRVSPAGPACHTGEPSCFFTTLATAEEHAAETSLSEVLGELSQVIRDRKEKRPEGSYTTKLFAGGIDRIAKKVGEESAEVIIASKNRDPEELCRESADLLYHLLVLWEQIGISPSRVGEELRRRRR
jgi:phosphoribosyl-ATP pyrophosphohydrolase/phosphoribosyl-AMP cyclohydrolase